MQNYHIWTKCGTIKPLCISVLGGKMPRLISRICKWLRLLCKYTNLAMNLWQHAYFLSNLKYANKSPKHVLWLYLHMSTMSL